MEVNEETCVLSPKQDIIPLPLVQKKCCARENGKNVWAEEGEKRYEMLSSGNGTAMANTKPEQQWLSICISLGCQEPVMDWGGHGLYPSLMNYWFWGRDSYWSLSGCNTVPNPWPHTVLVRIRGSQNKTKGCRHRKGAVGGKDGRGRREMRELGSK